MIAGNEGSIPSRAILTNEHGGNINYDAYGKDISMEENGEFTDYGYIVERGSSTEYFDGTKEDIPEEYLLTRANSEDDEEEE